MNNKSVIRLNEAVFHITEKHDRDGYCGTEIHCGSDGQRIIEQLPKIKELAKAGIYEASGGDRKDDFLCEILALLGGDEDA